MTLYSFSYREAMKNRRADPSCLWPDPRRESGKERLQGLMPVRITPGFQFDQKDRVMTLGSCFAREIETALAARGFDLPALSVTFSEHERPLGTSVNVALNKYTVHSMENEIRWAFEPHTHADEDFFLQADETLWHDSQLVHNLIPAPLPRMRDRRQRVSDMMTQLPQCRILVITLGLVETWFDCKTGLYLNGLPPRFTLNREPDRFELHVLEYTDIMASLDRIHALLDRYGHPDFKILLSVSPVPFKVTLTGQDAVAANTYGKSVQRAAAESFAARHANVDYVPSYEIVTQSPRDLAYMADNIHVTAPAVEHIMAGVLNAYQPAHTDGPLGCPHH